MGIKGLAKLLSDEAPDCMREVPLNSLHGRKIAIDASMAIYQFLIAVRSGNQNNAAVMLTNAEGETTSHIQGLFNRSIRFFVEGVRPVFVFDGKPPQIKSGELEKRREKRAKAQAALKQAQEDGNKKEEEKHSKRLVRAGQKENEDCRKLLKLMGIPVIVAPCEAEAQASALARSGLVYATGTEDMDALTFRTPVLVRKMTFASAAKSMVQTINYQKALEGLGLTHDEFVDLCILLGCDYCDTIRGVGPKTALKLIREHHTIEAILETLDRNKYGIPDSWIPNEVKKDKEQKNDDDTTDREDNDDDDDDKDDDDDEKDKENDKNDDEENDQVIEPIYVQARKLFNHHEVLDKPEIKWTECQPEPLTKFLVDDMGFNAERVKSSIEKLQKAYKATSKPQARMDSFFTVKANPNKAKSAAAKRKAAADAKKGGKKAKAGGFFGKRKR
mmetsp:Transcript_16161/g.22757  ORF Transcript_16161/g.22757 Transcript_16161/m.22757 type:complete len:445 (+) Transcript_16161:180-1514(+)